jgi:hypothetical protein
MLRIAFCFCTTCMKFLPWKSVKNPTTVVRRRLKYLQNTIPSELVSHLQVCRTDGPIITVLLLLPYLWASQQLLHVLFSQLDLFPPRLSVNLGTHLLRHWHVTVAWQCGLDVTSRHASTFGYALTLRARSVWYRYLAVAWGWYGYGLRTSGRNACITVRSSRLVW